MDVSKQVTGISDRNPAPEAEAFLFPLQGKQSAFKSQNVRTLTQGAFVFGPVLNGWCQGKPRGQREKQLGGSVS